MNRTEYVKDKILILIGNGACMLLLAGFLYLIRVSAVNIGLILFVWSLILLLFLCLDYRRMHRYFREVNRLLSELDKRYLIGEVMQTGPCLSDRMYHEILMKSNKSVIEAIYEMEEKQQDYREYIESWIHEVKVPITALCLLCENQKGEAVRSMQAELEKVDNYVEMALYYARSDEVYKDYLIRETVLQQVVEDTIIRNKHYMIQNHVSVDAKCGDSLVYTDTKWIGFILNQILINSVKYKDGDSGHIHIYTEEVSGGIRLVVKDDGIGIPENEQGRMFEKGFTGSNGRTGEKATGMGLYLCKKLCRKLGIEITAESKEGVFTKIILAFPVSSYLSKL